MHPPPDQVRRNAVLADVSPQHLDAVAACLRPQPLGLGAVLHPPGSPIATVYFPLVGVLSVVVDVDDDVVEVATVGDEGVAGISLFLGARSPTERSLVQVAGQALVMSAADFVRLAVPADGPLHGGVQRFTRTMLTQLARNSACNRVHAALPRAARWLLMTSDRMDGPTFPLTQHYLAQMLSVRRASVNEIARGLAAEGCISYTRGSITITDRDRLQARACTCYRAIRR